MTVLFAVLGVGLIALRHSGFGRRLTAMKDSPAASATLGQNLLTLKLAVFMASAAIAGVGGALMTAQLGSANMDRYLIFLSLSLLMITVVGGIGYVSGALFGGILFGVGFVALQETFDKLGADHLQLEGMFNFLANLTLVLPALMGVGLGRDPSGVVTRFVEDFSPLKRIRPVLVAGLAAEAVIYVAADNGTISNWWFVVLTAVVVVAMPQAAKALAPEAYAEAAEEREGEGEPDAARAAAAAEADLPLELIGVSRPFTPADREMLDRELDLPTVKAGSVRGEA
jgi:branched-chain amino acid transport system permease protein